MKTLAALTVLGIVLAAIPFEVVSFAVALFGSVGVVVIGLQLRKAVKRFDASIDELSRRRPNEA